MFTILVVEDDLPLQRMMCAFLGLNGYQTITAANGEEALRAIEKVLPDLVIADVMMPVMDGWELTRELRDAYPLMPIMLVTARTTLEDKRVGFSCGADDYLTKPVDLDELLLHVGALLRRSQAMTSHQLIIGECRLDYDSLTITRGSEIITLPKKEFYLLFKLLSNQRQIFTRRQLMDEIWGLDAHSDERTVDVHIKRVREKCEHIPDFDIITVRGLGYKAEKCNG
ncbi:MAG: response regulator transcription factor [Clostridiales bacterium]|nr:response regulator transcription factor [Clostridiales bacterium]